ncbi:hypothetical protein BDV96DRAFT_577961 [Lophiotrema nucula]|uniref:P-loop containing nucleoside triphosphate hydrolase protein n=1 Tax=Lophiotrema nucula TaxID=690887 RepID=A0A6A5Z240_9PLEO|nr:hypothetical protein BDV96DRAFT_577961 [Lophiotrema nucula]
MASSGTDSDYWSESSDEGSEVDASSDSGETESSYEPATASHPVLEWYSKVYSRRVDIVGDYAGTELFLVEGDSVLFECFSDKHLDFDPGFQLVHAVHAVESFLRGLVARRCNFHIAFFDQHEAHCVPPFARGSDDRRQKYLLARSLIIRHLRLNIPKTNPDIKVQVFRSLDSEQFASYVEATDLYFIMCHDGASSNESRKRNALNKTLDALAQEGHDDQELRTKVAFRKLIVWFIQRGYNAALVNGLEWRDTKIMTTVLESSQRVRTDAPLPGIAEDSSISAAGNMTLPRTVLNALKEDSLKVLTEREWLTVTTLSAMSAQSSDLKDFTSTFLRHTALLSELSLPQRLLEPPPTSTNPSFTKFCAIASDIVKSDSWISAVGDLNLTCDLADLVDLRLLWACRQDTKLGTVERLALLEDAMLALSGKPLKSHVVPTRKASDAGRMNGQLKKESVHQQRACRVLPFSNDIFDKHLAPIQLAVDKSPATTDELTARIFRELSHWHNSRRPVDPKIREDQVAKSQKQQFFARRRNQWFMAEMMAYAASLTNAVGKTLEPEIVTTGGKAKVPSRPVAEKPNETARGKPTGKAGAKKGAPSKKELMMAEIAASKNKKDEATADKILHGWKVTCEALEKESKLVPRYQKAQKYLISLNTDLKRDTLDAEIRLYLLNIYLRLWVAFCKDDRKQDGNHVAALIFDAVNSFSKYRGAVTKNIADSLTMTIRLLKLPPMAVPSPTAGDRPLTFNFALKGSTTLDLSIPLSEKDFQLSHCGPYFERSIDSAPDPRTPFEPDGWQRQVLDEIDAKNSLLVIAPTSAGKTFISFYAMKQVLESGDDDILVYVAPTKALVNQIAAEVQARFAKTYKYAGNSVWGIHTRDYRINNPTGCQILVTVPHILQIMLLAPSNAKSWSERVKWIIFDEVHCIGQAEDGLIWEQLLLLAPCPIIALSATVGNPNEFNAWLSSAQQAIGNKLVMVQHPHRYSDLRKFVYAPSRQKRFTFEGLPDNRAFGRLGLDDVEDFAFLHPVASLINRSRGIPDDFTLEARDCLTLWQSMTKHQNAQFPVDKSLDPSNLPRVVKKLDIINWYTGLKSVLKEWLADRNSPFDTILDDLSGTLKGYKKQLRADQQEEPSEDKADVEDEVGDSHKIGGILPLLSKLHSQDALPGIIFNYDRGLCEKMCAELLAALTEAETAWKETSPQWKTTLESWEAWKKAMAKVSKKGPPKVSKKKGGGQDDEILSKADLMKDEASSEASPWVSFDPDLPQEGFHFADKKKMSRDELNGLFRELIRREVPQWQLDSLMRGIGVHHAGMNRKYRQVVEMLFRKGFLRVVIATGTLALGINMPCKTVVFSGDSVFLTALNYRQAAGRAGRRGFDMLGNVVFHGISLSKIHRLISSRLPDLNGHFPITTTLVLRLFTLLNESKESPFSIRSINALLSQPRLYLGGEESKMTVLHHLRFSIEYLRRQQLLGPRGQPLNFAGTVSHLYYAENSSFAFHALLKGGYFHKLCAKIKKSPEPIVNELMLTMAHLFGRQYCRQADEERVKEIVKRSPSIVFLPAMPKKAARILREHNDETLSIYTDYVKTFADQHITEVDNTLPLTRIKIGGDGLPEYSDQLQRREPTTVRSPFVAISGPGDTFDSVHDLCSTVRSGVFLEEAVVPYVGLYPEESDLPLNAYLYDFLKHGNVEALITANRIRRGDVWFVLNDFSMVLATIVTSLSNFMKLTSESDLDFAEVRGEGEEAEEQQEDKYVPTDSGYDTASNASFATGPGLGKQEMPIQTKKRSKKVADSWDDEGEDDYEEVAEAQVDEGKDVKTSWEEGHGLLNVLKAFRLLKADFDTKFRAMWA